MDTKIITIGRQFGSAGHHIAKIIAEKLSYRFLDSELLSEAAKKSGICEEILKSHDEKPAQSLFYTSWYSPFHNTELPIGMQSFLAQFKTIKSLAETDNCVIVGRCADYVLKDHPHLLRVFIMADYDERIQNVMEHFNIDEKHAKNAISKADKNRASYYDYFSDKKWGYAESYDICINISRFKSHEAVADYIISFSNFAK